MANSRLLLPFAVLCLALQAFADNFTDLLEAITKDQFQTRQNRLLSFNTQANGDINMELAFNVPFIQIPVKKSLSMAKGAVANVNLGAVILGGAVAFGFAVVIPAIGLLFSKASTFGQYRNDGSWWFERLLTENDIDPTTCMQRMICFSVKSSTNNVSKGQSSSSDKIIDGLASSQWLRGAISGTAIHDALELALDGGSCTSKYGTCKFSFSSFQNLLFGLFSFGQ